ncbi:hypothetical protein MMC25_006143 [Agyrium rufum]|nr:hypothetical protein [Agyrium rufum]
MQEESTNLVFLRVEIINSATSRGLPPNLVAEDPSTSGIFKATDIHIAALQSELGFLFDPVNHVQTAETGNRSLNSRAPISARYTHHSTDTLPEMATFSMILADAFRKHPCGVEMGVEIKPLERRLWRQLLEGFDSSVNLDAKDRLTSIANSMRPPFIDHPGFKDSDSNPLKQVERFVDTLGPSLHDSWCSHRDAYVLHGDASAILGRASKQTFGFVRPSLKLPFLTTSRILTPKSEDLIPGYAETRDAASVHKQAPTVGSYTRLLYCPIRDGTIIQVVMKVLEEASLPVV